MILEKFKVADASGDQRLDKNELFSMLKEELGSVCCDAMQSFFFSFFLFSFFLFFFFLLGALNKSLLACC